MTATNLAQRHRAVSCVDVLAEHLIEDVTLGHSEDGLLLLVANLLVHDLDDSVFVLEQEVHLFDLINLGVDRVGKIAEALDQVLLILLESDDVLLMARNVSVKISDLRRLQLDLLVEVDLLLSNDIELLDLLVDNLLALLQSTVDLLDLLLDLLDLVLSVLNDLIAVQDLTLQMVRQLVLLGLLEVLVEQLLSLKQELSLILTNFLHRLQQVLNLFDILAGLSLVSDVRYIQLQFGGPLGVDRLHLGLQFSALALNTSQLGLELVNLLDVTGTLNISISIFKLVEILQLQLDLVLLTRQLHLELLGLDVDLVGVLSLITNLLRHLVAHHLELLLHHVDSALGYVRLLLEVVESVLQLIVSSLLTNVLLRQVGNIGLNLLLVFLGSLAVILLFLQLSLASLSGSVLLLALLVEAVQVGLALRDHILAKLVLHVFKLASVTLLDLVVDAGVSLGASI